MNEYKSIHLVKRIDGLNLMLEHNHNHHHFDCNSLLHDTIQDAISIDISNVTTNGSFDKL
jgi:hypothetical protein